jgi:hypothetical protein
LMVEPAPDDTATCGIGMALLANGISPMGEELGESIASMIRPEFSILDEDSREPDYRAFFELYPWVEKVKTNCPRCGEYLEDAEIIWHTFDFHVFRAQDMSLQELSEWVAMIEPQAEVRELISH